MLQNFQPVLVSTSCDKKEDAHNIGQRLLTKRLAACVQISAPILSLYWWQGKIAEDGEYVIAMKSDRRLFDQLVKEIRLIHPYEVPEIIAIPIVAVDHDYGNWVQEEIR